MLRLRRFGVAVLASWSVGACVITPIDDRREPPRDWPALSVKVERATEPLAKLCNLRSTVAEPLVGCSVVNFDRRDCVIYLAVDSRTVLEHERMHCLGYDHPGESTFRVAWERYKQVRRDQVAASEKRLTAN
jgi:hypothetical protein